jgi:hypothetical protein
LRLRLKLENATDIIGCRSSSAMVITSISMIRHPLAGRFDPEHALITDDIEYGGQSGWRSADRSSLGIGRSLSLFAASAWIETPLTLVT